MPVLVAAVITMLAAQLLDLMTFIEMVKRVGPVGEANPLVATLFGAHGLPLVAVAKVALVALLTAIVAGLMAKPAARLAVPVTVLIISAAILAGLVGGATNTAAIGLL
jgi:hypothetical protein